MRVRITGHTPMTGIPYLWCAGRHFPVVGHREVEVLDQREDPPEVFNEVVNPVTGAKQKLSVANQDVMGLDSYDKIVADGRFSIVQTDVIDAQISGAQVAAARDQVSRMAAENSDLLVKIATLESQVAILESELAEVQPDAITKTGKISKK